MNGEDPQTIIAKTTSLSNATTAAISDPQALVSSTAGQQPTAAVQSSQATADTVPMQTPLTQVIQSAASGKSVEINVAGAIVGSITAQTDNRVYSTTGTITINGVKYNVIVQQNINVLSWNQTPQVLAMLQNDTSPYSNGLSLSDELGLWPAGTRVIISRSTTGLSSSSPGQSSTIPGVDVPPNHSPSTALNQ